MKIYNVYLFLITFFFPTYSFITWLWGLVGKSVKRLIIKSEHDVIAFEHYKSRAAKKGHAPRHPLECSDGECVKIAGRSAAPRNTNQSIG